MHSCAKRGKGRIHSLFYDRKRREQLENTRFSLRTIYHDQWSCKCLPDLTMSSPSLQLPSPNGDGSSAAPLSTPHSSDTPSPESYPRPSREPAHVDGPSPPSLPRNIEEFVQLMKYREGLDEEARRRCDLIKHYAYSSLVNGRHLDRAVVLVLGVSGHGKSKTINSLVNRDIFSVARPSDGSITEVCIASLF